MEATGKILSFRAENFKRLRAVQIKPTGELVEISGRNAQGKSSVLDAIQAAIGGGKLVPSEPLRKGAKKGEVEIDLGDITVRRTFTPGGGGSLTVRAKDGSDIKSPQAALDRLCGLLAFDPLEFARMRAKDQVAALMRVCGLEAEFARLAKEREEAERLRRDFGRDKDSLQSRLAATPEVEGPDEVTSATAILARFKEAGEKNAENAELRKWLDGLRETESAQVAKIQELEAELAQVRKSLGEIRAAIAKDGPEIEALKDIDTAAIQNELDAIEDTNARARTRKARRQLAAELESVTAKWREQDRKIERIAEEREQRIAASNLPVKGLRFTDDGLTLNGVPFEQASSSEKIRVSAKLGLAQNHELKVMLIRDGSLLDEDALAELAEIAKQYDAQIWIERVADPADGIGVVIEDGEVVSVAPSDTAKVGGAA